MLGGAWCDAMHGSDTQRFSCNQLRYHGNSHFTREVLCERETASIHQSKPECLPTSPHAAFLTQINLWSRPLSAASNHASAWHIRLCINLHKGWCTPWMYTSGGCSVYHFVALHYWCSFYVPFDLSSCQSSPLTLRKAKKKTGMSC